ncbi:glycosyltransferase family 4 protein, partial [Leptospira kanakyensis]
MIQKNSHGSIAILIDDYLPDSTKVASKMMHELAIEFKSRGYEVDVYTPLILGKVQKGISNLNIQMDGINIFRFYAGKLKTASKPLRLINEILMPYKGILRYYNKLGSRNYQFVISYSPSIFWYPFVLFLKIKSNAKSFLILRDFFPQWVIDNGMIKEKSLIAKFFRWHESKCYSASDIIGIQSPANLNWFQDKFPIFRNKSTLLYNWASPLGFKSNQSQSRIKDKIGNFRKKYNLESKIIFFYGGNIGHAQDIRNLLQLAEDMVPYKDVFFVFMGSGDEVDLLKNWISDRNLQNTLYLESVDQGEFIQILQEVNVGLFSLHPHHTTHNFPGKILAYCQVGIPILGAVNTGNDIVSVIEGNGAGKISIAGDSKTLFKNAVLLSDEKVRKRMSEKSLLLMDTYFSTAKTVDLI